MDMVLAFNAATVAAEPIAPGVVRQKLMTQERVKDTRVAIDRLTLTTDATAWLELSATALGWLHMLEGEATLKAHLYADRMSDSHSAFLPAGLNVTLSTSKG